MLAAKHMNTNSQIMFWEKVDLENKSDVIWLINWCKGKPTILLNIIHGTIQQLTENNESESVFFSLDDFMNLEFKSWLCICEHEYLKLVNVALFEEIIDHNLIYDRNLFICQELINSRMLMINLAILKLFIDDRNSFTIEERKNLGLHQNANLNLNEHQIISHHNDKVETDSLNMTIKITREKDQTTITTPTNTPIVQNMPLTNTVTFQNEQVHIQKLRFRNGNEKKS